MEYMIEVFSLVTYWLTQLEVHLGVTYIGSYLLFLIAMWIVSNVISLVFDYFFDY